MRASLAPRPTPGSRDRTILLLPPGFLSEIAALVDQELGHLLPAESVDPARLHSAMRYSSFAGGKRIRPVLIVLGGEACGGKRQDLLAPAAAMEMIHCFSLIHDDLPALDNDDLRRGQPSLHRQFDEATAILAGDALLNLALELLALTPESATAEARNANVVSAARAVGTFGMIGGQMADLLGEKVGPLAPEEAATLLESIHRRKTGALLEASLTIGGRCAGASSVKLDALSRLGQSLGLLFQIRDDILDIEGDPEKIGKTAGKDIEAAKLTYPSLFGIEGSKQRLKQEAADSRQSILELEPSLAQDSLLELVRFLEDRDH